MPFFRVLLSRPDARYARYARLAAILAVITLALNGCAGLFGGDPLRVSVAGIEPVDGQGLEMRFNVKLRVQNPNESAVNFDGVSLALELNGKRFVRHSPSLAPRSRDRFRTSCVASLRAG